jgi:hypothetical protein
MKIGQERTRNRNGFNEQAQTEKNNLIHFMFAVFSMKMNATGPPNN